MTVSSKRGVGDTKGHLTGETNDLLTVLGTRDDAITNVKVGVVLDPLSAREQVRLGELLITAGQLLVRHAEIVLAATSEDQDPQVGEDQQVKTIRARSDAI